ncbi:MAG TPA: DUF2304 domain-containing protein [Microbacteriaceae bacterium]|nr:DUF2304 domain-containing protein [Microbacteriaceae bacterium]
MSPQILSIVLSIVFLVIVLLLLRSYVLPEKYAVIWLAAAVVSIVLSAIPGILDWLAALVGIQQPINLLFLAGFFVVFMLLMQVSLELARTRDELRRFVQQQAIETEEARRHGSE